MQRLHPVFNMMKLILAPKDQIKGCQVILLPAPIIEDGHKEWEVEEILDSQTHRRRFQYLVKWKGFGLKSNSWEAASDHFAPELVTEFHRKNLGAPRNIQTVDFGSIPFRPVPIPIVSSCHDLKGGVGVRGHPSDPPLMPLDPQAAPFHHPSHLMSHSPHAPSTHHELRLNPFVTPLALSSTF